MLDYNLLRKILLDDIVNSIRFIYKKKLKKVDEIYNQKFINLLNNKYNTDFNYRELLYLKDNFNSLENLHIFCPTCNKKNVFIKYTKGYTNYCCKKCVYTNKDIINKIKRKWNNKTKEELDLIVNSRRKTSIINWGYDNPSKSPIVKNIILETNKKNHGGKHNFASDNPNWNGKATLKKLYNVNNAYQISYVKDNLQKVLNDEEKELNRLFKIKYTKYINHDNSNYNNMEQHKRTNLIRRGVENYAQSQEYKDLYKNSEWVKNKIKKQYKTKKENGTFHTSDPEDEGYLKLLTKFPDAIHHYTIDKRYPFECDYYIPSLDLFIECHYFWTHGDQKYNCHEPFDKNSSKHQKMLQRWKDKNTKFYDNAIKVWTYYDPLKLETFNKNNLNYKIFYTEKEFNEWFNNF